MKSWKPVIGLEVHVQLSSESKIFCSDVNAFGADPNTNIGPVTIAHPGTLPVINRKVIDYAIKMGLALECEIASEMTFDRKNYFYPDLPKGYQITQDATPICTGGGLQVTLENGSNTKVSLTKIHLEEDAGKSIHEANATFTRVDLNRAGVPLIEIVTDPVIQSSEEAALFLSEIRRIIRYLDISDGNMEEGSLRCDANVSLHEGGTPLGSKVEIKNMNSIRNVKRAIDGEIERQQGLLDRGEKVISQTRSFDPQTGKSTEMRTKEELNDYRYFTEPDISPVIISKEWIDELVSTMPLLPGALREKLEIEYGLPSYDATVLTDDKEMVHFFFSVCEHTSHYKKVSNWLMGKVKSYLNESGRQISDFPIPANSMAELVNLVEEGTITSNVATQQLFPYLIEHPDKKTHEGVKALNLSTASSDHNIEEIIDKVLDSFPDKVKAFHHGKKGLTGLFMGEVMKVSKGKANPKEANQLILEALEKRK